jgi:hypothetical protein
MLKEINRGLRIVTGLVAVAALALLAGCAGSDLKIETTFDDAIDFSSLRTFGYQTGAFTTPDGVAVDPAVVDRIEDAVVGTLESKGLEFVQSGDQDFVTVVRGGRFRTIVSKYQDNWYVPAEDWVADTKYYDEGALVIGMRVGGDPEEVWLGVGTVRLGTEPATQEFLNELAAKILEDFPPK